MKRTVFAIIALLLAASPLSAETPLTVKPAQKRVTLTGFTRGDTTVTISSEVSGKMLKVNYDIGRTIGEAPFFEIDPTFIDFQIESLNQSIQAVEAARKQNESRVAYLRKEFIRMDKLHKGDRATEVRRDAAKEEYDQARLQRNSLAAEKAGLEAQLAELLERKRRHRIFAPEGWIVVRRMVEPGEIVTMNTPLAEVGDYQQLVVPLAVSAEMLDAIRALPELFDATLEGETVKTKLNWVNPEFNEETRKLAVELAVVNYGGERRGGLRFSLDLAIATEGVWIPKTAVINRYENPRVVRKGEEKPINIMVLGESDGHLIAAEDERLPVGTELAAP